MIDVFLKFDLSVKWSSGARCINFLYSSRVEARTLARLSRYRALSFYI